MRLVAGAAWLVTMAVAGSLAAQGLGEAAARERKRREAQKQAAAKEDKSKAKTFTDEDLQKYAGETPNGASTAGAAGEDGGATTSKGDASAATPVAKGDGEEVKRLRAAAIKTDLAQCQVSLAAARAAYKAAEVEEPSVEYPAGYPVSPAEARERVREMKNANLKAAKARVEQAERNCAALEDAARRADIPPGWVR